MQVHCWLPKPLSSLAVVCYRQPNVRAVVASLCLLLLATGAAPETARSANCGTMKPCECGDVLDGQSYMLPADLGPCPGDGLTLRGTAALDCAGHAIRGAGEPERGAKFPAITGLVLNRTKGATVRNCTVSDFRTGIELREATGSTIAGTTVVRNGDFYGRVGYGIHFTRSKKNTVRDCLVRGNADEGIHVGSGSDDNLLIANSAYDNGRENIYILNARGTQLLRNRAGGKVSAVLYMKHASMSRLEANEFDDRPVVVRGRSSGNAFIDNTMAGGLNLQMYTEQGSVAGPTANLVRGGRIGGAPVCVAMMGADGNRFEKVSVSGCPRIRAYSQTTTTNYFVGMKLERISLDLTGGANLRLLEHLRLEVIDGNRAPVGGATLGLRDRMGGTHEAPATESGGHADLEVPTHVVSPISLVPLTPVVLRVQAEGYTPLEHVLREPLPEGLTLTLEPAR
jgi:parallel beta-helix repeat protein